MQDRQKLWPQGVVTGSSKIFIQIEHSNSGGTGSPSSPAVAAAEAAALAAEAAAPAAAAAAPASDAADRRRRPPEAEESAQTSDILLLLLPPYNHGTCCSTAAHSTDGSSEPVLLQGPQEAHDKVHPIQDKHMQMLPQLSVLLLLFLHGAPKLHFIKH